MSKKKDGLVKQENNKEKPATGFHTNPERINKKGRPPAGESWAEILREIGEEIHPKTGKPFKEAVSRKIWNKAVGGDTQSIKEIMNRMDGMPKQSHEVEGNVTFVIDKSLGQKGGEPKE
ncbi:hypothetical protein LCGC14_2552650 [marine sediment metagenome]|uniref:Uncharacterized protein n=1 Tax=marine sediment metagenome TaxID=412755 RepID=A0A0F9BAD4_9ZZZZ